LVLLAAVEHLVPRDAMPAPVQLAQIEAPATPAMVSPIDLVWSAPADCPDGNAVRSEVLKLAGSQASSARHLKARAAIHPAAGAGWILSLMTELDGVTGERTLSGVSCESLSDAAALMLALILNPEVAVAASPPARAQEPTPSAATIAPAKHDDPWPRPTWLVGALAGVQMGVLEDLSPSFALSLGVGLGHFAMRLLPSLTPAQKIYTDARSGLGGRLWVEDVAALGCWAAPIGGAALTPCLGFDVTWLQGRGLGVSSPRDANVYWVSGDLALFAGLPLAHGLILEVGGIGLVPLSRPSVYLDGIRTVSRPAAFGFKALGGFAWRFD
jgi:hypothetical protein